MKWVIYALMSLVLISIAQASIVVWDMPKPVLNVTMSTAADSGLEENMTYYMICFFQLGTGYYGNAVSPASEEINFTINSTHKLPILNWSYINSTGQQEYGFWVPDNTQYATTSSAYGLGLSCRWDNYSMINATTGEPFKWRNRNDPDYTRYSITEGPHRWNHRYYTWSGDTKWQYPNTGVTIYVSDFYDDNNRYQSRYRLHPEIAWIEENNTPTSSAHRYAVVTKGLGFNMTHGRLGIEFTSKDDDWCDLILNLTGNDEYSDRYFISGVETTKDTCEEINEGVDSLNLFGSIFESIPADGYFTFENKVVTLTAGMPLRTNSKWIYFSNSVLNIIHPGWVEPDLKLKNVKVYFDSGAGIIDGLDTVRGVSLWKYAGSFTVYYGGTMNGYNFVDLPAFVQWRYARETATITNNVFDNAFLYIVHRYNAGDTYPGVNLTMENMTFYNDGVNNFDIEEDWYSGKTDPTIVHCINCISDRENGVVQVWYNDGLTPQGYLNYSFEAYHNFDVTGTDGLTGLNNVFINCTDNNSNNYQGNTDANGALSLKVVNYEAYKDFAGQGYASYKYNGLWECYLSKTGYIDQSLTIDAYGAQTRNVKMVVDSGSSIIIKPKSYTWIR